MPPATPLPCRDGAGTPTVTPASGGTPSPGPSPRDDDRGGAAAPGGAPGRAGEPVEGASGGAGLGAFLRALRNRRRPEDVGWPVHAGPAGPGGSGASRRVPGLRRQEVADLAGVSLDYYTRIEQGRVGEVSPAVLTALGRALRATPEESAHLHRLAASPARRRSSRAQAPARPSLLALADSFAVPAAVLTPSLDVVAANLVWRLLITPPGQSLTRDRNLVRDHFLEPYARVLVADWSLGARAGVAGLRVQAALHPHDERVQQLVQELLDRSEEFRRLWSMPDVDGSTHGRHRLLHPRAGQYTYDYETLQPPGDEGLIVTLFSPVPGTGSQEVLDTLLAEHHRGTEEERS